MNAQSTYHNVDGVRVFCRSAGRGQPLLLIHGFLVSQRCWQAVFGKLAESYHVFAVDLPGHGESDRPAHYSYSIAAFADTLARLLESIGLSRVNVMAHSMGGAVAVNLAANYPEKVSRMVLVDPAVYPLTFPLKGRLALQPVIGELLFKKLYSVRDIRNYFRTQVYHDPSLVTDEMVDFYWERFNRPGGRDATYASLKTLAGLDKIAGTPERVGCEVLVVWGEHDRLIPYSHSDRLLRELKRGKLAVIRGAGHPPMEERPREFLEAVLPFLESRGS